MGYSLTSLSLGDLNAEVVAFTVRIRRGDADLNPKKLLGQRSERSATLRMKVKEAKTLNIGSWNLLSLHRFTAHRN
jgi:hypothetical protein